MEQDGTQQQHHRESPKRRTSGQQQQGGVPYPQMGYMPHMGNPMQPQHMRHAEMMQVRSSWGNTHVNHVDFEVIDLSSRLHACELRRNVLYYVQIIMLLQWCPSEGMVDSPMVGLGLRVRGDGKESNTFTFECSNQ